MIYKKLNRPEFTIALLTALAIFLFYLFFNFNYITNFIDEKGDARTYDYYVRLGIPSFLFNPHHIGFDWLGQQFYKALSSHGYAGPSMLILQLRNLIISSMGLGIIFFLLYKISKKYFLSLTTVAIIAFTSAYWMYSQINDTPIIHSVLVAILFFAALYFPQAKNKYLFALFLGIFHAVNIFFHQLDSTFVFIIAFIILFAENFLSDEVRDLKNKPVDLVSGKEIKLQKYFNFRIYNLRFFLIYLSSLMIIVAAGYYYVGIVLIGLTLDPTKAKTFNRIKDATYFFNWLVLYTKIDYWGKGYEGNTFLKVVKGISEYFYQPQIIGGVPLKFDLKNFFASYAVLPNLIIVMIISVFTSTVVFFKKLYTRYRYAFIATLIFIFVYTVFACWWEPEYREFWVAPMFSFWALAFFNINFHVDNLKSFQPLPNIFIYSFLALVAMLLFYFNFTGFLYPYASEKYRKFDIVKVNVDSPIIPKGIYEKQK